MFRKSALKSFALAAMTASVATLGLNAASAGSYGYGNSYGNNNHNNGGYVSREAPRPFAHVNDYVWKQHVGWCYDRFKTYNAYDNTYQPYSGPRQQCWSPYITG